MAGFFIILVIVVLIIVFKSASSGGLGGVAGYGDYDRLLKSGIPARGILLAVSNTGAKVGPVSRRFDMRAVTIDIEVPGQAPYEVATSVLTPLNFARDVLPGATVELRVDPKDPSNIVIVGPGTGFVQAALRTS